MAPLHPAALGFLVEFLVFLLIGMAFGAVLELSGFGDSRKLAAQFYLRDLAVLKVMFTGIIVAAVLIHLAASLQVLDLRRVWVNPTYLWPGIMGGLIMGVGFIVGGFCPGTSLVAASTLKLDGIAFVLGGLGGVFLFGETVGRFDGWWNSSYFGRFTLADWLGVPAGVAVVLLVLMALGMFVLGEAAERRFGGAAEGAASGPAGRGGWIRRPARVSAGVLLVLAVAGAILGQPDARARWRWMARSGNIALTSRAVYVDPAEVVDLRGDLSVAVQVLEVRPEADYNLFHLEGSRRIDLATVEDPAFLRDLLGAPDNRVLFLAGNGEGAAVEAWRRLKAEGVTNLYVIARGVNGWLDAYPPDPRVAEPIADRDGLPENALAWRFHASVGAQCASAHPEILRRDVLPGGATAEAPAWMDEHGPVERPYVKKVVLERKVVVRGGCG